MQPTTVYTDRPQRRFDSGQIAPSSEQYFGSNTLTLLGSGFNLARVYAPAATCRSATHTDLFPQKASMGELDPNAQRDGETGRKTGALILLGILSMLVGIVLSLMVWGLGALFKLPVPLLPLLLLSVFGLPSLIVGIYAALKGFGRKP